MTNTYTKTRQLKAELDQHEHQIRKHEELIRAHRLIANDLRRKIEQRKREEQTMDRHSIELREGEELSGRRW
jgi:hypothetical protein